MDLDKESKNIDNYRLLLLRVSQELKATDLEQAKFVLRDKIPSGILDKSTTGISLLQNMEEFGFVTKEDLSFLGHLMDVIGRKDIGKIIEDKKRRHSKKSWLISVTDNASDSKFPDGDKSMDICIGTEISKLKGGGGISKQHRDIEYMMVANTDKVFGSFLETAECTVTNRRLSVKGELPDRFGCIKKGNWAKCEAIYLRVTKLKKAFPFELHARVTLEYGIAKQFQHQQSEALRLFNLARKDIDKVQDGTIQDILLSYYFHYKAILYCERGQFTVAKELLSNAKQVLVKFESGEALAHFYFAKGMFYVLKSHQSTDAFSKERINQKATEFFKMAAEHCQDEKKQTVGTEWCLRRSLIRIVYQILDCGTRKARKKLLKSAKIAQAQNQLEYVDRRRKEQHDEEPGQRKCEIYIAKADLEYRVSNLDKAAEYAAEAVAAAEFYELGAQLDTAKERLQFYSSYSLYRGQLIAAEQEVEKGNVEVAIKYMKKAVGIARLNGFDNELKKSQKYLKRYEARIQCARLLEDAEKCFKKWRIDGAVEKANNAKKVALTYGIHDYVGESSEKLHFYESIREKVETLLEVGFAVCILFLTLYVLTDRFTNRWH